MADQPKRRSPALLAEGPEHYAAVRALLLAAFPGTFEADLVERLRADGLAAVELVAADAGEIVAHILFSELDVEVDGRRVKAVSLAPVAVAPGAQGMGLGSALIRAGLRLLREQGREAVIVVGAPGYYGRFGFSAERADKLASPWSGPAFMALELAPGALAGEAGRVRYPAAFDAASGS